MNHKRKTRHGFYSRDETNPGETANNTSFKLLLYNGIMKAGLTVIDNK